MKTNLVFSYKPLWKLLIDRDLNKTQLQELSGISAATMAKLGKGGNVTTEVLARICETLECDVADICELVRASEPEA
ncbi:helix-turn-helix domain-containing protein [Trueperella pyogenes]|uniref:helix-turn-helix domain-containing protein n=1 Tax=Trueperella pyogenes TaxID=1661 RepID=UPI000F84FEBD|nr:helix-turn-helix transcriptional regulator [Trueperella pyogenes]AZQ99853.1 XRE family transcriptional regulator [Trueperella pyogenes]AZR01684.1 XRE family transcriptional regulator [Trueperella pyogenes]